MRRCGGVEIGSSLKWESGVESSTRSLLQRAPQPAALPLSLSPCLWWRQLTRLLSLGLLGPAHAAAEAAALRRGGGGGPVVRRCPVESRLQFFRMR